MKNITIDDFSIDLINKYDLRVPRYTSYPTVPNWGNDFNIENYKDELKSSSKSDDPISLYFHIPFCIRRCLFCACNVLVTKRKDRVERYLSYLKKEITSVSNLLESRNGVIQLHFGGGTPTHLSPAQLDNLLAFIFDKFNLRNDAERSIEIHPSVTSFDHLDVLNQYGFNRYSLGVQDFNPEVQEKLNRFQTYEETSDIISYLRSKNSVGINTDLIYGLPYQTLPEFEKTLDQILKIRPDRIALYSYAHFPTLFPHHKSIPLSVIPQGTTKLEIFIRARRILTDNGYEQIGFDHFALPTDDLSKSYHNRTLRRNFMGYTTKSGTDLVAFGYSGISELSTCYAQNSKDMKQYEELIDNYGVATVKGHHLSEDDKIRKQVIMNILCQGKINMEELKSEHKNKIDDIEKKSKLVISEFENIGFIEVTDQGWQTTKLGNIFGRIIASSYDAYFDTGEHLFSKTI